MKNSVKKVMHYTIVEMMMVIAVFMIILAMAVVAWGNGSSQTRLNTAARLVSTQLSLARTKAITERKNVGVFFSGKSSSNVKEQYAMVVCNDGNKDEILQGCDWEQLPGGIVFSTNKPSETSAATAAAPSAIIYTRNGSLKGSDTEFYLAAGDQAAGKVNKNVPYYTVKINPFTGRCVLTYHE